MKYVKDLFGNKINIKEQWDKSDRNKDGSLKNNPMHRYYGKLEGYKCKHCKFLIRKVYANTYYKCEKRGGVDKASSQTDHKVNWTACKLFKKDTNE